MERTGDGSQKRESAKIPLTHHAESPGPFTLRDTLMPTPSLSSEAHHSRKQQLRERDGF
jgi:hypothetical protein